MAAIHKTKKIMANRFLDKVDQYGSELYGKRSLGRVKNELSDEACNNVINALNNVARVNSRGNYLQDEYEIN